MLHSVLRINRFVLRMNHSVPRIDHSCPQMDHSCPQMDHFCPRMDHSCPQMDHFCPQMDHFCPQMDHSCPQMDHFCPRMDHSGSRMIRNRPLSRRRIDNRRRCLGAFWRKPPPDQDFLAGQGHTCQCPSLFSNWAAGSRSTLPSSWLILIVPAATLTSITFHRPPS